MNQTILENEGSSTMKGIFDRCSLWNIHCIEHLKNHFHGKQILGVCFSGGPDSVFLLLHCLYYQKKIVPPDTISIVLLHYMHHVRHDDVIDFKFVYKIANEFKIPVITASYSGEDTSEQSLRNARWSRIDNVCNVMKIDTVVTGHNFDDKIETTLINSIRGCGYDGLQGMISSVKRNDILNCVRPLLSIKKKDILNFLNTFEIPYLIDYTNGDSQISERNRIRKILVSGSDQGIFDTDWRKVFYSLVETPVSHTRINFKRCDTHPGWGKGELYFLDGLFSRSSGLKQCLELLGIRETTSFSQNQSWKQFCGGVGTGWFFIDNGAFLRTGCGIYFTTLEKDFWKGKVYTYDRCKGEGRQYPKELVTFEGIPFNKRLKRNVPVFRRNCLPVRCENDTVTEIYSLIR